MTLTPRERLLRSITEADWQRTVAGVAELHGWWWYHNPDSRRSNAGWPDLALLRPPRLLFVELKREVGRVSKTQAWMMTMLSLVPGVECYVWRPSDEPTVKEILR